MTKVYNENIFIKYLYKEASTDEVKAVEQILQKSSRIKRELRQMQLLSKSLNQLHLGPKQSTVKTIINRSKNQDWLIL
ncbi:MAG TPA: hypothetical protein PKD85_14095 [Saprospiraceae bacterium]|nr:hypothetical protein [Saprospiraceae bacterium]